jgi:hypothetical protein
MPTNVIRHGEANATAGMESTATRRAAERENKSPSHHVTTRLSTLSSRSFTDLHLLMASTPVVEAFTQLDVRLGPFT